MKRFWRGWTASNGQGCSLTALELILARLPSPIRRGKGFVACCPAHDDGRPSLQISQGDDGRVLLHCFAGCDPARIVAALGLTWKDLFHEGKAEPVRHWRRLRSSTPSPAPHQEWTDLAEQSSTALSTERRSLLAGQLGASEEALALIGLGWMGGRQAYSFPERDGQRRIVGIALRLKDGSKGFIAGGHRGLTIPANLDALAGTVLVVEGQSDVAACLTLGIAAVGRPSCNGGAAHLAELLSNRDVLVVGENDRKANGTWPGRNGARSIADKLATAWGRPVRWTLPPEGVKDIRAWLSRESPVEATA